MARRARAYEPRERASGCDGVGGADVRGCSASVFRLVLQLPSICRRCRGRVSQYRAGDYSAGGIFGSVIVVPGTISNVQIFVLGGVGVWGEGFDGGKRTGVLSAANVGGGVLVGLGGPVSLRLDYRLFRLGEVSKEEIGAISPSRKHPQRIAAGLYFKF